MDSSSAVEEHGLHKRILIVTVYPDETLPLPVPVQSVMSHLEPTSLEMTPSAMQQTVESSDVHDTLQTGGSLFDNWGNGDYTPGYDSPQEQSIPLMENLAHQPELPFMCKEQLLLANTNQRMSST